MKASSFFCFSALLVVLFASLLSPIAAQSPADPASPFTKEEEKTHSILSWDYVVLGEYTGWWGYWYPSCADSDQSPININADAVTNSNDQLTIETTTGDPLSYVGVIVAFKSAFNQLHVDLSANEILVNLRYSSQGDATDLPEFLFSSIDIYIPSVHNITTGGTSTQYDAEIVYNFVGTEYDSSTAATGTNLAATNTVSMNYLLKGTTDGSASAPVETFLSQIYNGCDSGSTQLTPLVPDTDYMYHYIGTELHPPCSKGFHTFVSTEPIAVELATITKFTEAVDSPNSNPQMKFRMEQPLGSRTVTKFSLNLTTLSPTFNSEAAAVVYRMVPTPLKYTGLIERYARDMLIGIVVVLCLSCGFLLFERYTYRLPYNLTWTNPTTKSEVFGVPMRYGYETGKPKVDYTAQINENSNHEMSTGDGSGSQKDFNGTKPAEEPK